jgi:hypothetical protein
MPITLFDLVWKTVVELGTAKTGLATGGTTTTLIDTDALRLVENDYFNEGTLFILKDQAGAGGAPEGEFSKIKDFTQTSKTVTVYDAFTVAPASGDTYGIANRRFPLFLIMEKINNALYMDGYIPGEDTSLTTVAGQTEYTMPAGASRDLRQVLVQTNEDSDMNDWTPVVNFDIKKTATGSGDLLVLSYELVAGRSLWLRYAKQHDRLDVATDELDESIHPDRIVYPAAAELLRWYRDKTRLRHLSDTIEHLDIKAARAKDLHPLPQLPPRSAKVMRFNRTLEIGNVYYRKEG